MEIIPKADGLHDIEGLRFEYHTNEDLTEFQLEPVIFDYDEAIMNAVVLLEGITEISGDVRVISQDLDEMYRELSEAAIELNLPER